MCRARHLHAIPDSTMASNMQTPLPHSDCSRRCLPATAPLNCVRVWTLACALGCVLASVPACTSSTRSGALRAPASAADAFLPVALRIHPLTHIELAAQGKSDVVLHLELKDRYGDTVKGLGALLVLLYAPSAGGDAMETQELRWNIADFAEPDANSKRFDRATRTYRFQLQAPEWVARALRDEKNGYIKLRAVLTTAPDPRPAPDTAAPHLPPPNTEPLTLSDDFIIQR